jgi:hypothetical protein
MSLELHVHTCSGLAVLRIAKKAMTGDLTGILAALFVGVRYLKEYPAHRRPSLPPITPVLKEPGIEEIVPLKRLDKDPGHELMHNVLALMTSSGKSL